MAKEATETEFQDAVLSTQEDLNKALKTIALSEPDVAFPNHLEELLTLTADKDIRLLEGYIQSILDRLNVPHLKDDVITHEDYFNHLRDYCNQLVEESGADIMMNLYIGGGVVRCLLANLYRFVHERKEAQKAMTSKAALADEAYKKPDSANLEEEAMSDADRAKIKQQSALKDALLQSSEFHIKQRTLAERDRLLSPFILGVGSDLDIYYELSTKDGHLLTQEEKAIGAKIALEIEEYINKVEDTLGLRDTKGDIKHSILPNADVKNYEKQISLALGQGGSLLDAMAFRLLDKDDKAERFKLPEKHLNILKDFLSGTYEYLEPVLEEYKQAGLSHKQAVRGMRPLLSMPFLTLKDDSVLVNELSELLSRLEKGEQLDAKAVEQFDKMVRNANFQLGGNRPYRAKEGEPLSIGLKIAEAVYKQGVGINEKVRFLLPSFLQNLPLDTRSSEDIKKQVKHFDELNAKDDNGNPKFLISHDDFIDHYTDNGLLYHGTSAQAGLCVLRGGFITSTKKQGVAVYGPGVYATSSLSTAASYSDGGLILPLKINPEDKRIIDWSTLPESLKQSLEQEAANSTPPYEHVFEMLRDRNKYAIDIIINEHVVIQNQSAIHLESSLEDMLDWVLSPVLTTLQKFQSLDEDAAGQARFKLMRDLENFYKDYNQYYELFGAIGLNLKNKEDPKNIWQNQIKPHFDQLPFCERLLIACTKDSEELLETLLQEGKSLIAQGQSIKDINLNIKDEKNTPLLIHAVGPTKTHEALVEWLLELGLDVNEKLNIDQDSALDKALGLGLYSIADKLVVNTNEQLLANAVYKAVSDENKEALKYLIDKGAPINELKSRLHYAPLMILASKGNLEMVQLMLEAGASPNQTDYSGTKTALMQAASGNHLEVVKALIDAGADIDLYSEVGATALSEAASGGATEVYDFLFDKTDPMHYGYVLLEAAKQGNLALVDSLLEHDADLKSWVPNDDTALTLAANNGHLDVVKRLLEKGKSQNLTFALLEAARGGHEEVFNYLLEQGADIHAKVSFSDSVLSLVIRGRNLSMVEKLLDSGVSIDAESIKYAIEANRNDIFAKFLERGFDVNIRMGSYRNDTPLIMAINNNRPELVSLLIRNGADVNLESRSETPLMCAAQRGNVQLFKTLIEAGAQLDKTVSNHSALSSAAGSVRNDDLTMVEYVLNVFKQAGILNKHIDFTLREAAYQGNVDIMQVLLEEGADVNAKFKHDSSDFYSKLGIDLKSKDDKIEYEQNALSKASGNGQLNAVNILLSRNCELDASDFRGETALMKACVGGHTLVVNALLKAGADLTIKDSRGNTALDFAKVNNQERVIKAIQEHQEKQAMKKTLKQSFESSRQASNKPGDESQAPEKNEKKPSIKKSRK